MKLYKNLSSALKEPKLVEALKISIMDKQLPPEIYELPNLTELYLEGNCEAILQRDSCWQNLKYLSIKFPQFRGDFSPLFCLEKLEVLKVLETPIKSLTLPLGLSAMPLKMLTLKDCGLESLPEEISLLSSLVELSLPQNNLTRLPDTFIYLQQLKRLNLDQNAFVRFPDLLKKMPYLTHLSIDGNAFDSQEKERIQREFHIWVS